MASIITPESLAAMRVEEDVAKLGGATKIAAALGTNLQTGLSKAQVAANREKYGENKLPEKEARGFWDHFAEAFEDTTLRILIGSAVSSIAFGFLFQGESTEIVQGVAILVAVAIVSLVNSFQNWSKDREFKSLAKLKEDRTVRVVREGKEINLSVYELVAGDLLVLESGEGLPCDGLLVSGYEVQVDTSSMNGESAPVAKSADGDSLLVGSCLIREGEGRMLVTAVGLRSQMGEMVTQVENEEVGNTPLQDRLEALAGDIGKIGTAAGALTFLVLTALWLMREVPEGATRNYQDLLQFFIVGVAIVVVAVPEGLPLAVTISLAFSMRRMMKDNNLVRQLAACETMGSATVIASDKTGTLTQNRMEVVEAWTAGKYYSSVEDMARDSLHSSHRVAKAICINSTAGLDFDHSPQMQFIGNPTEGALLFMVKKYLKRDYLDERAAAGAPLHRRPFNKENKFMTTVVRPDSPGEDAGVAYCKGAGEAIIDVCKYVQYPDGKQEAITQEMRLNLKDHVTAMARKGLRTLSVAYKRIPLEVAAHADNNWSKIMPYAEKEMVLLGIFGLEDPLRPGVEEAVQRCKSAGIRVMMITGDHPVTAKHIAEKAGIITRSDELVLEGSVFRAMPEADQLAVVSKLAVLARSSPMDKHKVVELLQRQGEVVAVTGDGTNDAPALRAADVGLAMGIAGTEVAKEACDIVILDDRFSSIVASVRWGRSIKENIRKFLTFQLTINMVALTLTFITACLNNGSTSALPLKPVQLLWVNLIMDSFAALALATEPPSEKLMEYAPQGKEERLITRTMIKNMVGHAVFQTVLLMWLDMTDSGAAAVGGGERGGDVHHTMVFTTFVALQVFNLFNCRTVHDEWNVLADFSSSVVAQVIVAIIVVMQFIMVQFGGALAATVPLTAGQWAVCVMLGLLSVPVGYILKVVPACETELAKLAPTHLTEEQKHFVEAPVAEVRAEHVAEAYAAAAATAAASASASATKAAPGSAGARKRKNTTST